MSFQGSLDYLYGLQLFGIKLGLDNMHALRERLQELQQPLPCVHVAGTNGKGSVSALLAEMLRHSGLRVGLYTSPHLNCFTERIRIDGQPVSPGELVELTNSIRTAAHDIPVTFFEATTAMALLAFQRRSVDFAVIETGMGGRLDATNIVQPALCLVTPVSFDHQPYLGGSLEQIAREKAGIIKPGVPVIVGKQVPVVTEVLKSVAAEQKAPIILADQNYSWTQEDSALTVHVGETNVSGLTTVLAGQHQKDNLAHAVTAALWLRSLGLPVSDQAIRQAGQTVHWPARLEWWPGRRRILLDAAHNAAGSRCLADYLQEEGVRQVRMVVGLTGDRRPEDVLEPLRRLMAKLYLVPVPGAASVPTSVLARWAQDNQVPAACFANHAAGLNAALRETEGDETVVICGSLYLTAALREILMKEHLAASTEAVGFA